eukprot:s1370_g6.t1
MAMAAAKVEHTDLPEHSLSILQQFREFWMENHLCDVVLKSSDGAEHRAHAAVLSAASKFFQNLLGGSFAEAARVQRGQPVEIAASKAAVSALLDYIYAGQPEVNLEAGLEILRLAEAYDLPKLASAIEAGFCASLDSSAALKILQVAQGLHDLKAACEEKVAQDFETCSQHPDFGKLRASQLARILRREDLSVSREEVVLKGIFNWLKISKEGDGSLGMLLQLVDFQSISVENLLRLGHLPVPGLNGDDLQREANEALRVRQQKRTQSPPDFRPKRRCLQHWSPDLGASTEVSGRQVLPNPAYSLRCHEGTLYAAGYDGGIRCWKPGSPEADAQQVAGQGARVTGINDLGEQIDISIAPTGEIFVADYQNCRLVSLHNGSGRLVLDELDEDDKICCSPNGVLYVLTAEALAKLEGSRLQTVLTLESLPADLQFEANAMFVTKEEVIFVVDHWSDRILRFNPAESFKPVVVGKVPAEQHPDLCDLFITEAGTIYVADHGQGKVLAIRPGEADFREVLQCPNPWRPMSLVVQDRSLYVSMVSPGDTTSGAVCLVHQLPSMENLRLYLSGCEGLRDGAYATLAEKLPQSLRFLELEPSGSFGEAGLAALRQRLLELELTLRLDCSYTQVDDDVAADLIGSDSWSALCRWQPLLAPAAPVDRGPQPTVDAVTPAVAPTPAKPAAPVQVELEAVKPKTLPDAKFKEAVVHRPSPASPAASPASSPASSSPRRLGGAASRARIGPDSKPASPGWAQTLLPELRPPGFAAWRDFWNRHATKRASMALGFSASGEKG